MNIIVEYDYSKESNNNFQYLNVENVKEYYENYFDEKIISFNEETESIYYEAEIPFMPIEGQRLGTRFGTCIVTHSFYEIDTTLTHYYDRTRIVVTEE